MDDTTAGAMNSTRPRHPRIAIRLPYDPDAVAGLRGRREVGDLLGGSELPGHEPKAVSDLVRRLEGELRTPLFQRGGRALVVTAGGRELLPYAEQAIEAARGGKQAVRSLLALEGGTATFGLLRNADYYLGTDLASEFLRLHPKVRIRLVGQNSAETAADVAAGRLEAGLVTLPIDDSGLEVLPLIRDEVVYVSADRERAAHPPTTATLCSVPLVLYDAHFAATDPARRQLDGRAQLIGRRIEPVIEVEYLATALSLAARGFGDSIVCRAAVAAEVLPRGLWLVSLDEPLFDTLALIKQRDRRLAPRDPRAGPSRARGAPASPAVGRGLCDDSAFRVHVVGRVRLSACQDGRGCRGRASGDYSFWEGKADRRLLRCT